MNEIVTKNYVNKCNANKQVFINLPKTEQDLIFLRYEVTNISCINI